MPDDERTRRRLGDETKARIADLSSGWAVDPDAPPEAQKPAMPSGATKPPRGDETEERIAELAGGWSIDPEDSAVALAPPLGRSTPSPEAAIKPVTPATRIPVPAIESPSGRAVSPTKPPSRRAVSPSTPPESTPPLARGVSPTNATEAPFVRKKAKTLPPPPPGSEARRQLETAIVEAKDTPLPINPARATKPTSPPQSPPTRGTKPTSPPPVPPTRTKSPTMQPPPVPSSISTNAVAGTIGGETGVIRLGDQVGAKTGVVLERAGSQPAPPPTGARAASADLNEESNRLTVPIGEFDLRGDPTNVDPSSSTSRFDRGDPTNVSDSDTTEANATSRVHNMGGRLRTVAALRRKRGTFGDVRYVSTALFGVRHARQELEELESKQAARLLERRKHIVILGRTAVVSDGFDHPSLGSSRDQLGTVEDERARHRGAVVAADQELERVTRDRQSHAMQFSSDLASINGELAELAKRLEPLLKEQIQVTKRGAELRDQLRRVDLQIQETTASLVSVRGQKQDPAAIQAELATLKADRIAVQRDEPKIASELDALNPRIAAIEAKRTESQNRHGELLQAEEDDKRRTEELLSAIGAKRKVMDRAAGDAEVVRDKILFELGERLYVDRPKDLGPQLAPVDAIDLELGTHDRRVMELREILSSIDKAKLARGILVIALVLGVIGVIAWWLYFNLA